MSRKRTHCSADLPGLHRTAGDGTGSLAAVARRGDGRRRRLPVHPRRADARRQQQVEPRDVRHDLDGSAGREADGRDVRQEHDRQGRIPGDRRDRAALRLHGGRPVPRRGPARRRPVQRCRRVDGRIQRGGDAGGLATEVAVAGEGGRWKKELEGPHAESGDGLQRAGGVGEVLPLLRRRAALSADGRRADT